MWNVFCQTACCTYMYNGYSNIQKQKSKGFCYQILKWLQLVGVCWELDISNKTIRKKIKLKNLVKAAQVTIQSLQRRTKFTPNQQYSNYLVQRDRREFKNWKPSKLLTHFLFLALHAINQKRYFIVLLGKQQKIRIMLRDIWHLVSKKPMSLR